MALSSSSYHALVSCPSLQEEFGGGVCKFRPDSVDPQAAVCWCQITAMQYSISRTWNYWQAWLEPEMETYLAGVNLEEALKSTPKEKGLKFHGTNIP